MASAARHNKAEICRNSVLPKPLTDFPNFSDSYEERDEIPTVKSTAVACEIKWPSGSSLVVSYHPDGNGESYQILWTVEAAATDLLIWPKDCLFLDEGQWYGGSELHRQHWPISKTSIPMQPYLSKDMVAHDDSVYGSFAEKYFLNSKGIAVVVDDDTPLWVSINEGNDGKICVMARYSDDEFPSRGSKVINLKYDVIVKDDIKATHIHTMKKYFRRPTGVPDERMFRYPVWSTWAKYKQDINEEAVLEFAKDIQDHGFPNSQLEIDDMWSSAYGDMAFNSEKFLDAKGMVKKLHEMGFRVTLWTTPFLNVESKSLQKSLDHRWIRDGSDLPKEASMFVKSSNGTPALVRWWNGFGALVDFTNPIASEWFKNKHVQLLKDFEIDSFKFDAGEAEFLPSVNGTSKQLRNSAEFSKVYAESVSEFGGMVEVRTGYRTQHLPIFVRMMDKDSNWGYTNGLRSLIPTCLTLGILGYPFILPDMIGGNVYHGQTIPNKELFIRWVEVSAFMPAMQFSVVPWQYNDENVVRIAKKYVELHAVYVTPIVARLAHLCTVEDGAPIVRPLWWLAPRDTRTLQIDDEFLVGNEILVAPILHEGKTSRDIYLPGPPGWKWKDMRTGNILKSSQWLRDYQLPLEEIAFFEAVKQ